MSAHQYYIDENYNCSESTIRMLNDKLNANMTEGEMKMVAGYGGGFGCGITCGVLCASVAALSNEMLTGKAHDNPDFKNVCGEYARLFANRFGAVNCAELKEKYFVEGERCLALLEENEKLFGEYMKELGMR